MNSTKLMCTPGYPMSGGAGAFTAKIKLSDWDIRIQRERRARIAAVAVHAQVVTTDVPGSMSALSCERRT